MLRVAPPLRRRCGPGPCRCHLHLPHAPGDRAGRPRCLPEVWHGPGTEDPAARRGGGRSRTPGHDSQVLDRRGAHAARVSDVDATDAGCAGRSLAGPDDRALAADGPRHAGRALGRLAVLRARLPLDRDRPPQHVHVDRHRHRGRLSLQPRCRAVSCAHPAPVSARRRRADVFRGGGGDHHAGAARAAARTAGPPTHRGRHSRAALARAARGPCGSRWRGTRGAAR